MDKRPIAFLDSGIGGLPYLDLVRNAHPKEAYIYFADSGNFPYGKKAPGELIASVERAVRYLIEHEAPKLFVIACNSASVVALKSLRKHFRHEFVGVVPAVKPAAAGSKKRRIAVLATDLTVGTDYLQDLIRQFASDCFVKKVAAGGLVEFIENRYSSADIGDYRSELDGLIRQCIRSDVDRVVLGCTHFIFMEEAIQSMLGPNICLVDSRNGVGSRVSFILERDGIKGGSEKVPGKMLVTGGTKNVHNYRWFAERFNLTIQFI
jgi:glutamate racemase